MKPVSLVGRGDIDAMIARVGLACQEHPIPVGSFVEVGVYQGGTAWHIARLARAFRRDCWLFDTFEGIPYAEAGVDSHRVGDFRDVDYDAICKSIWAINPCAKLVKGVFPASTVELTRRGFSITPIAFAHLDCDQYQSYKDSIRWLRPRMSSGSLMFFDDVDKLEGATRAVEEEFPRGRIIRPPAGKPYVRFK